MIEGRSEMALFMKKRRTRREIVFAIEINFASAALPKKMCLYSRRKISPDISRNESIINRK